ncbi:hypothetical protein H5410_022659 [Solanum commersonii]|uniref:Uncharacterized protein n=1 Tax=Solanum commersonii TaxID=4109 RepID=A0A9J5ZFF1_SOLCO|nr:hypothetical protein H5410_022659 [Solanum commersonii]
MTVVVIPNVSVSHIIDFFFFYGVWNIFSGYFIPRPWRMYYWCCPISWTLYGLVASHFGDLQNKSIDDERGTILETLLQLQAQYSCNSCSCDC